MYLITVIICLLMANGVLSYRYPKCCKTDEYFKKTNNSYQCTKNKNKRLQILTNETNFVNRGLDGECVEVKPKTLLFKVESGQLVIRPFKQPTFFRKCCPLNYTYNSVLHSCEEKPHQNHGYIREPFVKVGLPECKVIMDIHLNKRRDLYKLIDIQTQPYCVDENQKGSFTMRECKKDLEVCEDIRCVKKCCPDGQHFLKRRLCVDSYTSGLDLRSSPRIESPGDPFAIIINTTCSGIHVMNEQRYNFNLTKKGVFQYFSNYSNSIVSEDVNQTNSYCFEHVVESDDIGDGFYFFKCFKETPIEKRFIYPLVPKLLSCVFLVLTIIGHFLIGNTKSTFRKIWVNYCTCELFMYSFLCYTHTNISVENSTCKFLAYSLIYLTTATFTWLNVLCYDTWRTLGSCTLRPRRREFKKLGYYLTYAWGTPALLTLTIFFINKYNFLPHVVRPFAGSYKCFIEDRPNTYGYIVFLRLPHFLMQLFNIVLFVKTIVYCWMVKTQINAVNDTAKCKQKCHDVHKEKLGIALKLSVVMGATYIFDVVSGLVRFSEMGTIAEYAEVVWVTISSSQGIFIFIIFVCQKKTYNDILGKIKLLAGISAKTNSSSGISSPVICRKL